MKGETRLGIDDIAPVALVLIVAIITVGIGAMIIGEMAPSTYDETAVTNETHNSSGSVPETITTSNTDRGLESGSITLYVSDDTTGTDTLLTETTNYTVISLDDGTINVTSATDINSTNDQYKVSYTYNAHTNSTDVLDAGANAMVDFSDWFAVIVVVVVAVIILGLVMLLKGYSGSGGRT